MQTQRKWLWKGFFSVFLVFLLCLEIYSYNVNQGQNLTPISAALAVEPAPQLVRMPVMQREIEKPQMLKYEVRGGDTLSQLAIRYCSAIDEIMSGNPAIKNANVIYVGQVLSLQSGKCTSPESVEPSVRPEKTTVTGSTSRSEYFVVPASEKLPLSQTQLTRFQATHAACIEVFRKVDEIQELARQGKKMKDAPTRHEIVLCIEGEYGGFIQEASALYGIPATTIKAILYVESRGNPKAISSTGCRGLMQLLRSTAEGYGVNLDQILDPRENILGGTRVFADYLRLSRGNMDVALASYNLGPVGLKRKMESNGLVPSEFEYVLRVKKAAAFFERDMS